MKTLKGMKENFSSLENKALKNSKFIIGGMGTGTITTANSSAGGQVDKDTYRDGVWISRLIVGTPY